MVRVRGLSRPITLGKRLVGAVLVQKSLLSCSMLSQPTALLTCDVETMSRKGQPMGDREFRWIVLAIAATLVLMLWMIYKLDL